MGFKDWLAGNVAGPKGYGAVLGRHAREGGSALANAIFMSHGVARDSGPSLIFGTTRDMKLLGFKPKFAEITELDLGSLHKEEQLLLKSLHIAMVSFAFVVNSNGAVQYMRRENASKFCHGLGPALLKSAVDCGMFDTTDTARTEVWSYASSVSPNSASTILNLERPGSADVLESFILRAVAALGARLRYAFVRTGSTGFDILAVPLVEETLKSIGAATQQYRW
jgi:hypothetical protein